MTKDKTEYPALLPPGLHEVAIADLEDQFVRPFSPNGRRAEMVARLRAYIAALAELGIPLEVWLNGSFATQKLEPDDIDVAIVAPSAQVNELAPEKQRRLPQLVLERDAVRIRYSLDVYYLAREDERLRSYWRGWFGFTRTEQPKGIPYITAA